MNPSHHIHIGLAFRAALVGSALLLAAKSAGLAEGTGAFDPDQAIVTALAADAPLPAMNGADMQFLFEHVRLFEDTLAREPGRLEAP